jgi:hypothetical protein
MRAYAHKKAINMIQLSSLLILIISCSLWAKSSPSTNIKALNNMRISSGAMNDPANLNSFTRYKATNAIARCNDGSAPGYYLRKGTGTGKNRWILWLRGGGGCVDAQNCALRRKEVPGIMSSSLMPLWPESNEISGILSNKKNQNYDFYTYNHVILHYCSSDFWGGEGQSRVLADNSSVKFEGRKVLGEILTDLENRFNFKNASNIIFSGSSAGGAGAGLNMEFIRNRYPEKDIAGLIDAQWMVKHHLNKIPATLAPDHIFKLAVDFTGVIFPSACEAANTLSTRHQCLYAPYAYPYFPISTFIISDQLDRALLQIYNMYLCKSTSTDVSTYKPWLDSYLSVVKSNYAQLNGLYSSRTGNHDEMLRGNAFNSPYITSNNTSYSAREILGNWYFNRSGPKIIIQEPSAIQPPHLEIIKGFCVTPANSL